MITLLKNLLLSREERKNELVSKLEEEQRYLDEELDDENINTKAQPTSCMQNVIQNVNINDNEPKEENGNASNSGCFKRTGIISSLKSNHGTIDHGIFFDMNVALSVSCELKVGCRVEYLAYKHSATDHIKVVKIEQIIDQYWDDKQPTEQKIEEQIEELKSEQPRYFNTHQRNILGLITERKPDSILVDTDYKVMSIHLDSIEIDFVPKEGDRVYVCCNVQSDEHFIDKAGEILQEVSVHPARLMKQEKCTVKRVLNDWGVLNDDAYYTNDILPAACKLNVGDTVCADLIECERGEFIWRCIKLALIEQAYVPQIYESTQRVIEQKTAEHRAVTVSADISCVFTSTFQNKEIEFICTNNCDRPFRGSVEFLGRKRECQLRLIEPEPGAIFELPANDKITIRFEVVSKVYGENQEYFVIKFEKFRIKRSVTIIVCETEAEAEAVQNAIDLQKENEQNSNIPGAGGRNAAHRSRYYANQVWSKRSEVIPGVGIATKRRFIAQRIGYFEVPERLCKAYLTSDKKQDMLDNIEQMFPSIKQELCMANYVTRFQTLIYLEEIEYFVNFRNYDRERAHFTREGEYLSLQIENLAERRPSLVIGDVVRAINPWSDRDGDKRNYDGVIHKVLFNRVLLKFNAGFQEKYNGEDYRLEFFFSRFGFRKQHFAIQKVVRHLGEQFLFPSRVHLREQPQLDVQLDKDYNLQLNGNKYRWYNPILNPIQKVAVSKILRGEAQNMPYVIFGPPGTGKTMTLVETILQLVKLLPSSRLLVGTPSNSSADLITTRLIESGDLQAGDFIRLVSQNQIERELIPSHLQPYCATIDVAADGTCNDSMIVTESGLKLKCQMKYLGRHRVTIGTCSTLGNFLQMDFPPGHFTHVLIDESGQCTESEVMVAITQVSKTRGQVILAGDPHQLQAIVINRYAGERGFATSFLERILTRSPYLRDIIRYPDSCGFDPRLVTKLLYNYRALPSILNVYNELFYDSELMPMIKDDSREAQMIQNISDLLPDSQTRPPTHGAFFYGMLSENMQEKDSPSWYNPHEAKNVFLMTLQLYRKNIKPENIGIITPYMKQVKHLRNIFTTADIAMPKIGSVEEFQGQERDIILISTVRSTKKHLPNDIRHSLGFVQCAKRMNVAISRARYLLYIFGNPHLLVLDPCWRSYIKYCVENDAYLGCDLPAGLYETSDELTANGVNE
ncbi:probable RNA helicase armi [Musca vetustissima]|uniref:probable RNA helicase armi n=1 Tax=Musca vetustissima TaxID=27455 RepID=UPI002AB6E2C1|nr:probable RNA helicase armi [Musca vetustissima]